MKTIDLFCGAGGFTLGAEAAGAEVVLGVDKWLPAVETSRRAGHRVVCADVGDVQGWLGNVGADVDLVIGGPPCQPFSSAGLKKGRHDERDGYPAALRVLDAVRPTWAAFENVKGFLGSKHTRYRKELLAMFSKRYSWVGVWLLNAANYGVPQYRRRVFIVCGPRPVAPPAPTHGPPNRVQNLFATLQPWRSMHEALGIPCAHLFTTGRHEDGRPIKKVKPGAASPTITAHIG